MFWSMFPFTKAFGPQQPHIRFLNSCCLRCELQRFPSLTLIRSGDFLHLFVLFWCRVGLTWPFQDLPETRSRIGYDWIPFFLDKSTCSSPQEKILKTYFSKLMVQGKGLLNCCSSRWKMTNLTPLRFSPRIKGPWRLHRWIWVCCFASMCCLQNMVCWCLL